jgi:hypothetical protein
MKSRVHLCSKSPSSAKLLSHLDIKILEISDLAMANDEKVNIAVAYFSLNFIHDQK